MRRPLLLIAAVCFLGVPATAQAYEFHFVTPISQNPVTQAKIQRALSFQINRQVAKHWALDPVSFGPTGIPIVIESNARIAVDCQEGGGCHTHAAAPVIYIADENYKGSEGWSTAHGNNGAESWGVSHEIIETELDRSGATLLGGLRAEACDPVDGDHYSLWGVSVANFVYPGWFSAGSPGPWDQMRTLHRPGAYPDGEAPN